MKLIDYLFYKLHRFYYRAQGSRDGAIMAMITIGCLFYLNLVVITGYLGQLLMFDLIKTDFESIIAGVCLTIFSYFLFIRKKRYIEIEERFKGETKSQKLLGTLSIIFYVIISFLPILLR